MPGAEPSRSRTDSVPTIEEYFGASPATRESLERLFSYSIRMENGTLRYTYPQRLDDVNAWIEPLLPSSRPLRIMDVAVSSGISTLEWAESLRRAGVEFTLTAGDLLVDGFVVSVGRRLHVLMDSAGRPLRFDLWGHAVPNPPGSRNLLRFGLPLLLLREVAARCVAARRGTEPARLQGDGARLRPVRCRAVRFTDPRLADRRDVTVIQDDILRDSGLRDRFHLVRAANILNRCYHADRELAAMLANLRDRLVVGGILVVCRTTEAERNQGTAFVRTPEGRLEVVSQTGRGSEVDEIADRIPLPTPR